MGNIGIRTVPHKGARNLVPCGGLPLPQGQSAAGDQIGGPLVRRGVNTDILH